MTKNEKLEQIKLIAEKLFIDEMNVLNLAQTIKNIKLDWILPDAAAKRCISIAEDFVNEFESYEKKFDKSDSNDKDPGDPRK